MFYDEIIRCNKALNVDVVKNHIYASINPYVGCQHQCKYCYVQADKYSKTQDLSFVKVKYNILDILLKEISKYKIKYFSGVIYLGTSSDPYQDKEKKYFFSSKIISFILNHTSYNVHIFTKSSLVLKDIDLFKKFSNRINISISLITANEKIKKIFEPNSDSIEKRLSCIKYLNLEGISCGCAVMPILPYITDSEKNFEELFFNLRKNGCRYIWWGYLTLRENIKNIKKQSQKNLYYKVLQEYFSNLIDNYESLYRNSFLPDIRYQKIIDKKIINIAQKYNLSYFGPTWKYNKSFQQQLFLDLKY